MKNHSLKLLTFFSLIVLIVLSACNRNNDKILENADTMPDSNPDRALSILSEIENPYQLEKKEKADYWRVRSEAHSRKGTAMTRDSLILYSLNYYQEVQDTTNLLKSYLLAGEYYKWMGQLDSVNSLLTNGLSVSVEARDTVYITRFLYKLGINELSKNNKKDAVKYFKERINFDKNAHNSYYLAGLFSDNDSTEYYLNKGVELALQKGDTLFAAHYLRNYAGILSKNKQYNKAIELINKTGKLSDFYKDFGVNHQLKTEVYIAIGRLDSAQYYLDKAKNEKRKSSFGSYSDKNLIGNQNALYALQAIIDTKNSKSVDFTPMYQFNDSIISETIKKNEILLEEITERNNFEQQNLRLLVNKQYTQIILVIAVLLIITVVTTTYLYSSKKRRKIEEVEERAESLQRLFREALSVKDEKQNNSQLFRKTLLQQLGIIKLIATTSGKQNKTLLPQIIDISEESISTDSLLNWADLYSIIDSVYENFYTNLNGKYGDILNEKEIQLCCLLCADFSTTEISAVMQQSMQTIYQRKSSVRNKLKMKDKEDILDFLTE